jgi:hypothetical protein
VFYFLFLFGLFFKHWQFIFIAVCVLKLAGLGVLCYRAFLPFKKIVLRNRFVQQSSNGSRNGSATRDSASAGGGAVAPSTNRPAVNSANRASGRTEVRHSVCVYTTILQHVQQRTHCSSSGACSTEHI